MAASPPFFDQALAYPSKGREAPLECFGNDRLLLTRLGLEQKARPGQPAR
jgi:hypothetical protein